jgi:hypothetical protein
MRWLRFEKSEMRTLLLEVESVPVVMVQVADKVRRVGCDEYWYILYQGGLSSNTRAAIPR